MYLLFYFRHNESRIKYDLIIDFICMKLEVDKKIYIVTLKMFNKYIEYFYDYGINMHL